MELCCVSPSPSPWSCLLLLLILSPLPVPPPQRIAAGNAKSSALAAFNSFWANQSYAKYPGLLTVPVQPRLKTPRVFVPYLWDAIKAYHVAIRAVIERGE